MAGDQAEEEKSRNMVVSSSTTAGFCYPDVSSSSNPNNIQTHLLNQIQSFHDSTTPEIFNLTSGGMDMINNFQHKNNSLQQHHHQSFFSKHGGNNPTVVVPSSSKTAGGFYDHDQNHLIAAAVAAAEEANNHDQDHHSASWQDQNNNRLLVDDSSLRCVFTCEGNERPSQGLSLSLSSNNPSSIGLQSFELRQQQQHHPTIQDHHHHHDLRYLSASSSNSRDGFYGKSVNNTMIQHHHHQQAGHHHHHQVHLRNSKFLGPAQELLNEFCCLGSKQTDSPSVVKKPLVVKTNNNQWEDDQQHGSTSSLNNNTSSSKKPTTLLSSLELIELQKRKAKLLSMLEEVDRRYKHYCDQMKAVVSSFEAVAGNGAAKVYSALASKAMSRHFRCLRDGIVVQIQDTKTAMGEKDPVAPGTTRGETPRLRLLDQTLRQQRALQQMTMMESHPWRPQRGLPERSVSVLRAWLFEHFLHPYPSDVDKHILARQTGLSRSQVSNWFINARVRLWKPMVEEMYLEETKDHLDNINNNNNNMDSSADLPTGLVIDDFRSNQNPNTRGEDQKPTPDELVRIDSECLSSIISTNPDPKNDGKDSRPSLQNHHHHHQHQNQISFGRVTTDNTYGAMELDFSSYNHHTGNAVTTYDHASHESGHHTFGGGGGGGGGGVSLTLGLQQHGGSSLGLAFSPASQNSLFYSRDHIIDDCQPVQYSILDGEGQNNLPYRNLLGAQLLHDLAG